VNLESRRELAVVASFEAGDGTLSADDEAWRFVRAVEFARGAVWQPATQRDNAWLVPCAAGCRVRYRFALREAADALHDIDTAVASGDVLLAPPSTWLLHPSVPAHKARFELHVEPGPDARFVTAFEPAPGGRANSYRADASVLEDASFSAFGPLFVTEVPAGDSTVLLGVAPQGLKLTEAQTVAWVSASAGAVAHYYQGHLPARHTLVLLIKGSGDDTRGETLGGGGPAVLVRASDLVTASTTADDWVLTHELFHANFPDIGREHAWLSEGLATYLEPVARARVGLVSETKFWRDLIDGLPQGLPEAGDQGLEHTRTWGRTYWGGALFCLVADVTLREKTGNRRSLDDVLLAIGKTGASDDVFWDIQQVLAVGDRATGTTVLHDVYARLAEKPGNVDLSNFFARLGVRAQGHSVVFDDSAPLAQIRRSITARGPG
jgi:predicted metalloprotease with PDZ domain